MKEDSISPSKTQSICPENILAAERPFVFVIAVSIMVFVLVNFMLEKCGLVVSSDVSGAKVLNALIKLGFKLLFLPVVAGVSYELLKLLAKSDCLLCAYSARPVWLFKTYDERADRRYARSVHHRVQNGACNG